MRTGRSAKENHTAHYASTLICPQEPRRSINLKLKHDTFFFFNRTGGRWFQQSNLSTKQTWARRFSNRTGHVHCWNSAGARCLLKWNWSTTREIELARHLSNRTGARWFLKSKWSAREADLSIMLVEIELEHDDCGNRSGVHLEKPNLSTILVE